MTGHAVLGAAASLGGIEYRTYSADNYTNFMLDYNFAGPLFPIDDLDDFDKVAVVWATAIRCTQWDRFIHTDTYTHRHTYTHTRRRRHARKRWERARLDCHHQVHHWQ